MSIAHQIATPVPARRGRRHGVGLRPVAPSRRGYALVRIAGLLSVTALGAALAAGVLLVGVLMLLSSLGG